MRKGVGAVGLGLLWTLVLASRAVAGDCAETVPVATIESHLEAAEARFVAMDADGFKLAAAGVRAEAACARTVLSGAQAARIHTLMGLAAFLDRDLDRAEEAFAAARSSEPMWELDEALVPQGNPVRGVFAERSLADVTRHPIDSPTEGAVYFDGGETTLRPDQLPSLFQRLDGDGGVVQGSYLLPDDPDPSWQLEDPVAVGSTTTRTRRGPSAEKVGLLAGAGVAAVGAGVLFAMASSAAATYRDPDTGYGELDALRGQANSLSIAAGGAGVVALGLGVSGVVVGRW